MQNWAAPDFSASDWYLPKAKQKQIYFEKKNNIGFFPASSCQKKVTQQSDPNFSETFES